MNNKIQKPTKTEQDKIVKRYLSKLKEFSALNEEQLREKFKDKMSSTDKLAVRDCLLEIMRNKAVTDAEDTLTKDAATEIFNEVKKEE